MGLLSKSIGTKIPLILPFSFMFLKESQKNFYAEKICTPYSISYNMFNAIQ